MNDYPNSKPGATGESVPAFRSDIAQADAVRASALTGLQQLRTARRNYAIREQIQLAATLGEDHPDVIRLEAEVAVEQRFGKALNAEIDRVSISTPAVDERAWTLYGFVRDQDLQGQPNLTVALFDRTSHWIEALGHVCTDSRGCFQLRYAPSGKPEPGRRPEVFLRVSNRKHDVLYRDKRPMIVVIGEIKYREIIVTGESESCQPPSDTPPKPAPTKSSAKASKTGKTRSSKKPPKDQKL